MGAALAARGRCCLACRPPNTTFRPTARPTDPRRSHHRRRWCCRALATTRWTATSSCRCAAAAGRLGAGCCLRAGLRASGRALQGTLCGRRCGAGCAAASPWLPAAAELRRLPLSCPGLPTAGPDGLAALPLPLPVRRDRRVSTPGLLGFAGSRGQQRPLEEPQPQQGCCCRRAAAVASTQRCLAPPRPARPVYPVRCLRYRRYLTSLTDPLIAAYQAFGGPAAGQARAAVCAGCRGLALHSLLVWRALPHGCLPVL